MRGASFAAVVALASGVLASGLVMGCSSSGRGTSGDIGPTGGQISVAGLILTVPAGALSSTVKIGVSASSSAVPGYALNSPLYRFSPDGLTFALPVSVSITLTQPASGGRIYRSNESGGYDGVATVNAGTAVDATISHFSSGFAGNESAVDIDMGVDLLPADGSATPSDAASSDGSPVDLAEVDLAHTDLAHVDLARDFAGATACTVDVNCTGGYCETAGFALDGGFCEPIGCAPSFITGGTVTGTPVAVAAFDGNHRLDLLIADATSFSVAFGNGDGTFAAPVHQTTVASGASYDVVDWDGNGVPDLFVSFGTTSFQSRFGQGDGSFTVGPTVSPSPGTLVMAAGEFTGDSKADVVLGYNSTLIGLDLYPGNGDGTFGAIQVTSLNPPFASLGFTTLVKQRGTSGHDAYAYAVKGAGGHTVYTEAGKRCSATTLSGTSGPTVLLSGDLDGDGLGDVVADLPNGVMVAGNMTSFGTLLTTKSACTFASQSIAADGPAQLVGDFNGDGKGDVVVGGNRLMCGNGDGTLQAPVSFAGASTISVQGDFDGDQRNDYIAGGAVYLNRN